jgi:hypothetical protein
VDVLVVVARERVPLVVPQERVKHVNTLQPPLPDRHHNYYSAPVKTIYFIGKCSVGRPQARWSDDLRRTAGRRWMRGEMARKWRGLCPVDCSRLMMMMMMNLCYQIYVSVWCPAQNKRIAPLLFNGCRKRRLKD